MTRQELQKARETAHDLLYSMVQHEGKPDPKLVCSLVDMVEHITYSIEAEIDMEQERRIVIKI